MADLLSLNSPQPSRAELRFGEGAQPRRPTDAQPAGIFPEPDRTKRKPPASWTAAVFWRFWRMAREEKGGRGLPHSKTLARWVGPRLGCSALSPSATPSTLQALALVCIIGIAAMCTGNGQELYTDASDVSPTEVDRVYLKGLQYLTRNQNAEGTWPDKSYGSEPAVVGLAIVSMLAHGDDPNFGPYAEPIRRGLNYILKQMNPQTGYIGRSMYNHGFATLALAEAYGAIQDPRLGPALTKAVSLIVNAQARNPLGAWRYSPESTDADTTVSGAQMVALYAARNAGIPVPEAVLKRGHNFFTTCQTPDGGYGYTPGSSPNGARTAIGCLVLALAKEKNTRAFQLASNYLRKAPSDSTYQQYYLYYAAQAFFHMSPDDWRRWNRTNVKSLAATQNPDGSWDGQFGPTFSTAACLLSLALNYRYLPIYER